MAEPYAMPGHTKFVAGFVQCELLSVFRCRLPLTTFMQRTLETQAQIRELIAPPSLHNMRTSFADSEHFVKALENLGMENPVILNILRVETKRRTVTAGLSSST